MLAMSHATSHSSLYLLDDRLMSDYEVTLVNDNSKLDRPWEALLTSC